MKITRSILYYLTVLLLIIFTSNACTNDKMENNPSPDPNPNPGTCDTNNVTFSGTISPIIQSNCFSGCHNGSSPTSGFSLESYAGVKAKVDDGRLYGAVAHLPGFVAMPQSGGMLSACNLAEIKAWIDAGAQNN